MHKYAATESGLIVAEIAGDSFIRKAASAALQVPQQHIYKEGHRALFADIPKRDGFLYVRNRAISSRTNENYDSWPAGDIATTEPGYGYLTFIGRPVFVEHKNENHRRTRGVNIASILHEDTNHDGTPDTWVELLKEVDPKAFPKLAKAILTGRVNRTSMGADVGFSECSKCGNIASSPATYCQHIPQAKGARFERFDGKTGSKHADIVVEICRKVSFFEDTFIVTQPADPTAILIDASIQGESRKTSRAIPVSPTGHIAMTFEDEQSFRPDRNDVNVPNTPIRTVAYREIALPPKVDTLGHDTCPVCSTENSYVGDRCSVCNSQKPPTNYMEPDTSVAGQVSDYVDSQDGSEDSTEPMENDDLTCDNCGQAFTSAQSDESQGNPYLLPAANMVSDEEELEDEKAGGLPGDPPVDGQVPATDAEPQQDVDDLTAIQHTSPQEDEEEVSGAPGATQTPVPTEENDDEEGNPLIQVNPDENKVVGEVDGQTNAPGEQTGDMEDPEADPAEAEADMGFQEGDQCPSCGEGVLVPTSEVQDEVDSPMDGPGPGMDADNDPDNQQDAEEPGAPPFAAEDSKQDDSSDDPSEDDSDDDEDPDDSDDSGRKKHRDDKAVTKQSHSHGKETSTMTDRPNPAAAERRALKEALNVQAQHIEAQGKLLRTLNSEREQMHKAFGQMTARLKSTEAQLGKAVTALKVQAVRNETAERQIVHIASAAGLEKGVVEIGKAGYAKSAAIVKRSSAANPANPVGEPAPEAPVITEAEAMQPSARDDVTQIGASPLADVSADATVAVDQPYGVYAESPVGLNRVDVTAPVEGTQTQRPPSETIVPVDVRIGNPDNPTPSFQWTMGPVGSPGMQLPPGPSVGVTANKRAYATLHLAKLQIQAGLSTGDEIEIAASLDSSGMSDQSIADKIETLAAVLKNKNSVEAPRRLVPKAASAERVVPSLRSTASSSAIQGSSVSDDEVAFF